MIKPTPNFNFSEPLLNTTNLGFIRLLVENSVFNVNRRKNQFLYNDSNSTSNNNLNSDNNKAIIPSACELTELAELIKEETKGKVIIEPDKNTMKCKMEKNKGHLALM